MLQYPTEQASHALPWVCQAWEVQEPCDARSALADEHAHSGRQMWLRRLLCDAQTCLRRSSEVEPPVMASTTYEQCAAPRVSHVHSRRSTATHRCSSTRGAGRTWRGGVGRCRRPEHSALVCLLSAQRQWLVRLRVGCGCIACHSAAVQRSSLARLCRKQRCFRSSEV